MQIERSAVSEIRTGEVVIGTTCARLSDDNSPIYKKVMLQARPENTGIIYIGRHRMMFEPGAVAYATHYSPGENDDVIVHAPEAGAEYNGVEFRWIDDPGFPGMVEIQQVANDFEIHFELGVVTAMDVKTAFDCGGFDWTCTVSGDGSGVITTVGIDVSVGGVDPVIPDGFALAPGKGIEIYIDDLTKVFAVASAEGQVVNWFAG